MPESHRWQTNTLGPTVTFEKASPKSSLYIQIWGSYSGQSLWIKLDVKSGSVFRGKEPLLGPWAFFPASHPYTMQFKHTQRNILMYEVNALMRVARCHFVTFSFLHPQPRLPVYTEHNLFSSIRHTFPEYSVTDISLQVVDAVQTILFFVFCLCFCRLLFLHQPCSLCCCFLALLPPSLQLLCAQQVLPPGWLFPEACEKGLEKEKSTTETNCSSKSYVWCPP